MLSRSQPPAELSSLQNSPTAKVEVIRPQPGPQEKASSCAADILVYGGSAGGGKRLSIDTPIPTPDGWKLMGELVAGDLVFDEHGRPCKVTAVHAVTLSTRAYQLTFDDGSTIEADAEHLWKTFNAKELSALARHSDEWRARRRANRPSRVTGKKSPIFTAAIQARNRHAPPSTMDAPSGTVRTTQEVAVTLRTPTGRANHAIAVTCPIECDDKKLELDPYLLGVWLGDGTAREGSITSADQEIVEAFKENGFSVTTCKDKYAYYIKGLPAKLRPLGVLSNKHIPQVYLRSSIGQRLALLQGLMDADGYADRDGGVSFSNSEPRLCDAVQELVHSLGWKSSRRIKYPTLNGVECSPSWTVAFTPTQHVFRLPRKRDRQRMATRRATKFRYVKACDPIAPRYMRCITVDSPSHLYLAGRVMVPTHNTWDLLLEPIYHKDVPQFRAVMFRRTMPNITNAGSMWDQSMKIYPYAGAKPNASSFHWTFPSGARVEFASLQHESSVLDWKSSEIALIGFDQIEEFTEHMFWYMLSRNRSTCGVAPYVRCTVNPVPEDDKIGGWVHKLIQWWLDEDTGLPIPERDAVLRWFIRVGDALQWFDSRHEAVEQAIASGFPETSAKLMPKSLTFIAAKLTDNQKLMDADPGYYANLMAMPLVERERLLGGNWNIRPQSGNVFNRAWFTIVDVAPVDTLWVRYWDKAGTEGAGAFTAGVKMGFSPTTGRYYVGDVRHGQWAEYEREQNIRQCAELDTSAITIYVEQEPGSGGKESARHTVLHTVPGYACFADRVKGDKYFRARPYAAMVQAMNVSLVRGPWNEAYLSELHNYAPDGNGYKDQVDASSGAFNKLTAGKPLEIGNTVITEKEKAIQAEEAAEAARQHVMNVGCVFPGEW